MNKFNDHRTVQPTANTAEPSPSRKSPSLRLEKRTIRTLTGVELQLVAGGGYCRPSCGDSCATTVKAL